LINLFQSIHPYRVRLDFKESASGSILLFQSTHPHRVRPFQIFSWGTFFEISIHAPTQGATLRDVTITPPVKFQSTHPHRVRLPFSTVPLKLFRFQSTHPHRVRLLDRLPPDFTSNFNPRTHTGCDIEMSMMTSSSLRFQSTHPHRVRLTALALE